MIGRNPKTGKPVKILQLDTSISKDRKVLIWNNIDPRYTQGVVGSARICETTSILVLQDTDDDYKWLMKNNWQSMNMIIAPKAVLDRVGEDKLKEMQISNVICLEEVGDLYPFLGGPWDGTDVDACMIASGLLRMSHVWLGATTTRSIPELQVLTELPVSPQLWFITQYYRPDITKRAKEITLCLKKNCENPLIDRVVLLNESDMSKHFPSTDKIQQEIIGNRLTYAAVIRWIQENAPKNTICVFANSDIYLDSTWSVLWKIDIENKFLSLLRYEAAEDIPDDKHTIFGPRPDSQDTWVIFSDSVKARTWDFSALDFPFGKAGCDNAINIEMMRQKFMIVNPSLTIKTHHVHTSQVRTYDPTDIVDKSIYLYIEPTALQDMKTLFTPVVKRTLQRRPFSRKIQGPSLQQKKTLCSMLGREETYKLEAEGANLYTPGPLNIYSEDRVFQTYNGLAFTYNSLFIGKAKAASEAWSQSQISGLSPCLYVDVGLVAPFPDEYAENSYDFMLKYLSNIFILREHAGGVGEFASPRGKPFVDVLQIFNWKQPEIPVIPRENSLQVWANKSYILLPTDTPQVTCEQIDALRKNLFVRNGTETPDWVSEVQDPKRYVILADEEIFTNETVKAVEAAFPEITFQVVWPGTSLLVVLEKLTGAAGLLHASEWRLSWMLPRGASVFEVQNEMKVTGESLHLAAAAGLNHFIHMCPKGRLTEKGRMKILETMKSLFTPVSVASTQLPLLLLPKSPKDFFAHAGDSFREMARLWEAKGYVRLVEDSVVQVWLNGIGDTLLYDRPTLDWLNAAPIEEKKYRVALFGNPEPPEGGKAWSFWPRRPALVEELSVQATRTDRKQALVFYGRIENHVQKKHRTGLKWLEACSDSSMPMGSETYPFTQKEYLEKLLDARFGLCLAGYGKKCHREVECMAMGCVPICAPEVDMTNYAESPVEGVHYFRAETPEDARRLSLETTAEKHAEMSAACIDWWKRNASCEGMWELTKKLTAAAPAK
jgi:hypothetical protein